MQLLERSVSELLREEPARARVFEQYAIDYGCQSKLTLAEACRQGQLDPEVVQASLAAVSPAVADPFISIRLGALADEIVERHHSYVREQGDRVQALLDKVTRVHGAKEPRLRAIWSLFQQLHAELLLHMRKEEGVLFPYCKRLEAGEAQAGASVAMPIRVMEADHGKARQQMADLLQLSDGCQAPEWACNSLRVCYHELADYLDDLEEHMHLENDLLFPAAQRREAELLAARENE